MESRIEDIVSATISGESYNKPGESRIENLLIDLKEQINDKVDKESGKGLSTNDFTTAEKTKLDDLAEIKSIGTGLALDSTTGELIATGGGGGGGTSDYTELINKPQINGVILSDNKSLSDLGITYESETAASDGTTLSLVTTGEKYTWNNKQSAIDDLSTIRSGAALGATAVQPVTGKGLSTNDYTDMEKSKLAGIAEGAEVNEIEGIKVNNTTINPDVNKVVNITVPTTAADVSALPDTTKYAAALSLTINSSTYVMTGQLKDQNGDNLGTAQTIDLPLESVVVGGSYNSQTKKVVLTLQNGNTIEFSVADLVSGLQIELSASNKLNPAYIAYDSTHRAVSDTEKSTWNGKQSALSSAQLDAVNSGITSEDVAQIETNKNNISWLVDTGVKNLLDYGKIKTINSLFTWSGNTGTNKGVTIKIESNALKISASNTSESVHIYISPEADTWKNGNTYRLMGVPQASAENVNLNIQSGSPDYYTYYSKISNQEVTFPNVNTRIRFSIGSGATFSEVTIPLMMCSVAAYSASSAYQPYAMSNAELTAKEQVNENNILLNTQNGVKNLFNLTKASETDNTVVFTVNSDKTVTVNGTASPYNSIFNLDNWTCTKAGTYVVSGVPSGGSWTPSPNTYRIRVAVNGTWKGDDVGNGFALTLAVGDVINLQINTGKSYTANNLIFKPMICEKSIYDVSQTYQPYAMSNAELTAAIQALQAQLANQ